MAQDFRASQVRTGKIIASGSSAGNARIAIYDIAADSTTTPNQGDINSSVFVTSSIGSDVFLFVSGTNNSLNINADERRLALFSDIAISGSVLFPTSSDPSKTAIYGLIWRGEATDAYIAHVDGGDPGLFNLAYYNERGGMRFDIFGDDPVTTVYEFAGGPAKFYDGISGSLQRTTNGDPAFLGTGSVTVSTNSAGQIIISASDGGGGGGTTLQSAYEAGNVITVTSSVGTILITGNIASTSASLHIIPTVADYRALRVSDTSNTREQLLIHGTNAPFAGAGIILRSQGSYYGYIGWQDGTNETLSATEAAMDASIYYDDSNARLRLQDRNSNGKTAIWNPNGSVDRAHVEFQNSNPGTGYLFPGQPTARLHNSGTLIQSGAATFYNGLSGSLTQLHDGSSYLIAGANVTITTNSNGSITIEASGSGGGPIPLKQTVGLNLTTTTTASTIAGQFYWNENDYSSAPSTARLYIVGNSLGTNTASFRLYNVTSGAYVHLDGTSPWLSITASNSTFITSSNLIGATNFDTSHVYELQVSSSTSGSLAYVGGAAFLVEAPGGGGGSGVVQWNEGSPSPRLNTTASVAIAGGLGSSYFAEDAGSDIVFFVSGAVDSKNTSTRGTTLFGGDLHVSGGAFVGTTGSTSQDRVYTTTTTNATPTELISFQLTGDNLYDFTVTVNAASTGSGLTKRFKRNFAVSYCNLTASILEDSVFVPVPDVSGSSGANAWEVGVRTSGSYMIVDITGSASTAIRWGGKLEGFGVSG